MRYYVKRGGKIASITISDELSQYLIIKLGGTKYNCGAAIPAVSRITGRANGVRHGLGKGLAQHWINTLVAGSPDMPEKNVSQWVQAQILHFIVDPAILQRLATVEANAEAYQKAKVAGQIDQGLDQLAMLRRKM